MQVLRHVARATIHFQAPVVALGDFDGVHIGHQRVLRRAAELARQLGTQPAALVFVRHRSGGDRVIPSIDGLRQRLNRIAGLGADPIILLQAFPGHPSGESWARALDELVAARLPVQTIVVAPSDLNGADSLTTAARCRGIALELGERVFVEGIEVSSTALRQAILDGDLATARALSGHDPEVSGRVRRGHQRGRTIGFPTANLRIAGIALPPNGVYAVRVRIGQSLHGGVANLGVNPTFGGGARTLEPHIFDLDEDLYGRRIDVQFVKALREERKFASIDELVQQIRRDAAAARILLLESP